MTDETAHPPCAQPKAQFENPLSQPPVAVIGGGPAGLMAAEVMAMAGLQVDVYDAMPSMGRKFLLAGIGGLNITHSEAYGLFCDRYADREDVLKPILDGFTPDALRAWVSGLGVDTFVGSSGRVFPTEMKAAPLLRAWLHRLRGLGVRLHVRHRWLGWSPEGNLRLVSPQGEVSVAASATVLALGGASWPKLGSDGAWVPLLEQFDVQVAQLQSANCGFEVNWSAYIQERYAGSPLKNIALYFSDSNGQTHGRLGEVLISTNGIEGNLIYAYSREIRNEIVVKGNCCLQLDLHPSKTVSEIESILLRRRKSQSIATILKTRLGITGVKLALVREVLSNTEFEDSHRVASTVKALPIVVLAPRPIAEAISTAGGVRFDELDPRMMLTKRPGVFVAGEMLDWEAPTGGYLLTACMATGRQAGTGVVAWLRATS